MKKWKVSLIVGIILGGGAAFAGSQEILANLLQEAKKTEAGLTDFSADRGEKFFRAERVNSKGDKVSCTTCHTADPKKVGRTRANKDIKPMAPSVNPERFTDSAKVEKWFKRNCDDVYERPCTAKEKGDFVKFMLSIK